MSHPPSPQPPMMGTWDVVVLIARPFDIHGDSYLELAVRLDANDIATGVIGAGGEAVVRVPAHAWKTPPAAGDRVRLTFLMGQVTRVESL